MATVTRARSYFRRHPGEAMADLLGLAMICGFIALGFSLPALV